jgi:DHA1 family multidrug resistance protein-like MFS transporter
MAIWAGVTACAPSCGPVLGGFSVPVYGWRWTQWELLWLAGPILILMLVALPETSASTILLRRARRLRQATGNMNIKSQSEIDQKHLSVKDIAFHALVKPWEINVLDPAVLFTTLYTGLIYGLVYTYFEAFPIAYVNVYHFDLGELGLTFLSILVSLLIVLPIYMIYFRVVVEQKIFKNLSEGVGSLEQFLLAGVWVSWVLPAGLFLFGKFGHL